MKEQDILIAGTGALALLIGAQLAAAGHRLKLLGTWKEGLEALNKHGIRITRPDGSVDAYPVQATSSPADCAGMQHALVLVKSWQTGRVARQLRNCLAPHGVALTLQNGFGNRETLSEQLGSERVAMGVTTTGATIIGPGQVRPGGAGMISIESHPRVQPLIDALRKAGFDLHETGSAASLVWSKLVINAAINPLTALLRIPNGMLLERPETRTMLADLALEAAAVAAALHIPLTFEDPVQAAEDVARRTASNYSSMYQDVHRGAPTEIDAICGAIVEVAREEGVHAPVNATLWRLVRAISPAANDNKG